MGCFLSCTVRCPPEGLQCFVLKALGEYLLRTCFLEDAQQLVPVLGVRLIRRNISAQHILVTWCGHSCPPSKGDGANGERQGTSRVPTGLVHGTTGDSKAWGSNARADICASCLSAQARGQRVARARFAFYCPGRHPNLLRCAEDAKNDGRCSCSTQHKAKRYARQRLGSGWAAG